MVTKKVKVINKEGFHIRPASNLCNEALKYDSKITFQIGSTVGNAKSVLSVLAAGVQMGDELEFIFDGKDETKACEEITAFVENGLGIQDES